MSIPYDRKDHFYQKAKREGYRSRAAYKLIELDQKNRLFRSGMSVLDLGCAPGSWSQVAAEKIGAQGKVLGVDLNQVEPITNATLIVGDITEQTTFDEIVRILNGKVDLVISDLSPSLSGIKFADALRAAGLVESAYYCASHCLRQGGDFVAKIFPGPDTDKLTKELRQSFNSVSREVLSSTRKTSKEFYLVAKGYKG